MLTKLTIRNFKRFSEVEVELGNPVVFIGPNNSGKTTALQALALWEVGLKRWTEKYSGKARTPEKWPGVTIGRRDLLAIPVASSRLLWHENNVRRVVRSDGHQQTDNVYLDVIVEGVGTNGAWECGLEFYYANEESFYCRPLRLDDARTPPRMDVPPEAASVQVAYLPPMSGLASVETRLESGAVNVRIGEGRTAEVLRNLCYTIFSERPEAWQKLTTHIHDSFGVDLNSPNYIAARGEITLDYEERGIRLDIASSGRGLQQTLLLLSYMYSNPGAVLVLDEPDAHLETLRQRQTYQLITDVARDSGSQVIAASHSEVILDEAVGKDTVVAFVGQSVHQAKDRASQLRKWLKEIPFDHYFQAEQTGWVLYLEGSTDLAILRAFARHLRLSQAEKALTRPAVHYVGNQPNRARGHFHGLREALPQLRGIALFDRMETGESPNDPLLHLSWMRREIENYLCSRATLTAYAEALDPGSLFALTRRSEMENAIEKLENALITLGKDSPWSPGLKVSDEFLKPLFRDFYERCSVANPLSKSSFYELVSYIPEDEIDIEVNEKLEAITKVAEGGT